jgi:hypothetical protein
MTADAVIEVCLATSLLLFPARRHEPGYRPQAAPGRLSPRAAAVSCVG